MDTGSLEIQRIRVNRNVWKASLTKEIISLEDNLDQIYYTAGLKPHRIVQEDENDESTIVDHQKGIPDGEIKDFETIINEQLAGVVKAARNICALVSSVTDFDLPIPVLVLLRLASRVGSIRWSDFSKKLQGTMAKRYIYTKCSPELITTSLTMFKWISTILGTNILPFQSFINSNTLAMLEWTRTSSLAKVNEEQYLLIRSQIFQNIISSGEQLSLGLNFDPKQVKSMLEIELLENLDMLFVIDEVVVASKLAAKMTSSSASGGGDDDDINNATNNSSTTESLKDKCACDALICLDRLFIIYADFLDAQLELKLKTHVIQTCIKIYRDFERNVIGLACRRQLLHLLETLASRPYASTTTELVWHVFELAEKMETDPEIRYLTRRAIKLGLAHRPIVVSHFEVHNLYANRLATFDDDQEQRRQDEDDQDDNDDEPIAVDSNATEQQANESFEHQGDDATALTAGATAARAVEAEQPQEVAIDKSTIAAVVTVAASAPAPAPALADDEMQVDNDEVEILSVTPPKSAPRASEDIAVAVINIDENAKDSNETEVPSPVKKTSPTKVSPAKESPAKVVVDVETAAVASAQPVDSSKSDASQVEEEKKKNDEGEMEAAVDERVQSYLNFFVDKPASQGQ